MSILDDVRFAFRMLAKRRGITAMIVAVLAVGIGANTAIFTLFNAVLVRGLPFPEGDRIYFLEASNRERSQSNLNASFPEYQDWREQTGQLEDLAALSNGGYNLSDDSAAPERVSGTRVSANAFRVLRVDPELGRHFLPAEDRPGGAAAVILSHGLWRDRYAQDPEILGRSIRIDGSPRTVVGVMPPRFRFPTEAELWLPLAADGDWLKRDSRWIKVFGRLAPGATRESAQGEMELIAERLEREHPETNESVSVRLLSGNEEFNGGNIEEMFLAMLGAVGFVLLIACANVANVQLTRAADRGREISIRSALGAGRWRIARQLLIESVVLSTAGGGLGLTLAYAGVRLFDAATIEQRPYFIDFRFDLTVFAYLAGVCLITGVLFGLAPAFYALRTNVNDSLKAGSRSQTSGVGARRFSTAMVVGEVALSVVLLAGAGLMLRSFWNVYTMDLGVRTEDTVVGLVALPEVDYPEPSDRLAFHEAVLSELRAIPGAISVTSASHLPGQGYSRQRVEIEGSPADDPEQLPSEAALVVDSDYFQALGAPLLQGRAFTPADDLDTPKVAIVSQLFAAKYWPDEDAVGKRFRLGEEDNREWLRVVGVGPTIRQNNASDREIMPAAYLPYRQEPDRYYYWLVHSGLGAASLADAFRAAVAQVDPDLPVQDLMPLERRMERSRWAYSVFGSVFGAFAAIALGLAGVGVFALVADSVRRRVPEFGVRLAFGAKPAEILRLVLSQAMLRVLGGVILGVPLAYLAAQMLEAVLVGVDSSDVVTLSAVSLFLMATSLAACWLPARRVIGIDPVAALRNE